MTILKACRANDGVEFALDTDRLTVAGPTQVVAVAYRVGGFIALLFQASPAILSYATIDEVLLRPQGIAQPPSDTVAYIRKLKLASEQAMQVASGHQGLIEAVRGVGYRLAGEWSVGRDPVLPRNAFDDLTAVAMASISLMASTPLVEDEVGGLTLDHSACQTEIDLLVSGFDSAVASLLEQLANAPSDLVNQVVAMLREILTYITFSRIGRVDDATWRRLFRNELLERIRVLSAALT